MQEVLIPVLTGISLLLAGIPVGYFLWFRDRKEQIALRQQLALDNESLKFRLRDAESHAVEVQDQLQRREAKTDNLQILCHDLLASREKMIQHANSLESELYSARRQWEQASTQLESEDKSLNALLESERDRNQTLIRERDQALKNSDGHQSLISGLKKRSENQESTIRVLRSRLEETLVELSARAESQRQLQNGMAAELQQELSNAQTKIQQLEADNEELRFECSTITQKYADLQESGLRNESILKHVSEENVRLQQASHQHEDQKEWKNIANDWQIRMESVLRQRDSAFDQLRTLTEEMVRMKNHARINEDTIRNLRRERGAVLMRNRQSMPQYPRIHESPNEEKSEADLLSKEYGGPTRIDPFRGVVFIEAPRVRDDLKKIYGVANVLEQRLNASGIYAYRQIMKWDENAIREFSELLVFKDRIYRDDWLGQAARLYLQKQRSAVA